MRVILAVGCNVYQYANPLGGAENDARRIFEALIREEVGDYAQHCSKLLLSPTIDQVREAIRDVLFANGQIDTFTFFFAGHGSVRRGSFYMWVQDSKYESQSVSALSLSDIFRSINEAAPKQSNIIIDACESGGLVSDLGVLLKPDMLGDAGTPGITLVATSAQDQYSGETEAGGLGTNAILDCIEGRDFIQDTASTLDLVEIGRRISERFRTADQNPVIWGLNLFGPPRFCKNPFFDSDPARPLRDVIQGWSSVSDTAVRDHHDDLWNAYASVSGKWSAHEFKHAIDLIIAPLVSSPDTLAGVVGRFGVTSLERAKLSEDPFRHALVSATFAVSLLPYLDHDSIRSVAHRFLHNTTSSLISAGSRLVSDLNSDRFALLAKRGGGLTDLFYLPLRVSQTLGYIAALRWLIPRNDEHYSTAVELFTTLLRLVLEHYSGSILTMSDVQAPYWAVTISRAIEAGLLEEAEQLAGFLFHSFIKCGGHVARIDIPPEKTLDYLLARKANDFSESRELVAQPNASLTVLLKAAHLMDLAEIFDDSLWKIDGLSFSAYLNDDFSQYGAQMMGGGQNLVWTIGQDVFRVEDLVKSWPATPTPRSNQETAIVILASLLYPDRLAWFCLDPAVT